MIYLNVGAGSVISIRYFKFLRQNLGHMQALTLFGFMENSASPIGHCGKTTLLIILKVAQLLGGSHYVTITLNTSSFLSLSIYLYLGIEVDKWGTDTIVSHLNSLFGDTVSHVGHSGLGFPMPLCLSVCC